MCSLLSVHQFNSVLNFCWVGGFVGLAIINIGISVSCVQLETECKMHKFRFFIFFIVAIDAVIMHTST